MAQRSCDTVSASEFVRTFINVIETFDAQEKKTTASVAISTAAEILKCKQPAKGSDSDKYIRAILLTVLDARNDDNVNVWRDFKARFDNRLARENFDLKSIQAKIKQFNITPQKKCDIATNYGKNCSMRTWISANGDAVSCAYYCLKNCDKWNLEPLFNWPEKVKILSYDNRLVEIDIDEVSLTFDFNFDSADEDKLNILGTMIGAVDEEKTEDLRQWYINGTEDLGDLPASAYIPIAKRDLGAKLCSYIKKFPDRITVMKVTLVINSEDMEIGDTSTAYMKFSTPYIRPEATWKFHPYTLEADADSGSYKISLEMWLSD